MDAVRGMMVESMSSFWWGADKFFVTTGQEITAQGKLIGQKPMDGTQTFENTHKNLLQEETNKQAKGD